MAQKIVAQDIPSGETGVTQYTVGTSANNIVQLDGTGQLSIGGEWAAESNPQHFVGGIDELRISKSLRQINYDLGFSWDTATWYGDRDALVVLGDGTMGVQTFERQIATDNVTGTCGSTNWRAQTFTPTVTHTVQKITLKLYRGTAGTGNFNVGIYATALSKPTGAALTSASVACSSLSGSDYTETDITVPDYELTADTMYAVVWSAPSEVAGAIYARGTNSNVYAGGAWQESSDSGSSWTTDSTSDFFFEEWGVTSSGSNTSKVAASSSALFGVPGSGNSIILVV